MIVVVTGTGTEVGKTWFAAATIGALRAAGHTVLARKPVQSFAMDDPAPTDADVLARATGEATDDVCPPHRRLPMAVAPPMAAAGLALAVRYGLPADAYLLPMAPTPPTGRDERAPTIMKGDAVKDRDGDTVGVVREVRFDEKTGRITGFVVMAGGGLERLVGGGQVAEIPHDAIARITEGTVYLNGDREEIVGVEHETGTH